MRRASSTAAAALRHTQTERAQHLTVVVELGVRRATLAAVALEIAAGDDEELRRAARSIVSSPLLNLR
jgi:hypothetical protein